MYTENESSLALSTPTDTLQKKVDVYLIASEREARVCSFWVGVYRKGSLSPQELLAHKKTSEILTAAVNEGVDCQEPLVLAETTEGTSTVFFLAPIQNEKLSDSHLWLDKLCEAICEWGPKSPGIYFAPELLGTDLSSKLLSLIMKTLLIKNQFQTIYLLLGSHGIHPILNSVLKLKHKIKEESDTDIYIYH